MSNPNWPQFPGVPNMAVDNKGRPNTLDYAPGKHNGTPLSQALINPIINGICDLRDDLDATINNDRKFVSGLGHEALDHDVTNLYGNKDSDRTRLQVDLKDGNTLINARIEDLQDEVSRAKGAEAQLLPLTGGTITGELYTDGNFIDTNGYSLSQPNGNAIGDNRFYSQLAQDKAGNLFGRLIMKNHGVWTHVLECTPDGQLSNINGKSLALVDDVSAETQRAQKAEATKYPLTGGNVHGPVMVDATFTDTTGKTLSLPIGANFNGLQYYLQIADDKNARTTYGRLIIKDGEGAFTTILQGDNLGNLTNFEGNTLPILQSAQLGGDQAFWVNAKHGDWISFPKPFKNYWTDGSTSNVFVSITPSPPWGNDNDDSNNTLVATIDRTENGKSLNMTNEGFRVRINHFYTVKDAHGNYWSSPAWLSVRAVCI